MRMLPHRHIGVIVCHHPMGLLQLGTGILVSKNLILTCAHVIHQKDYNAFFPNIYFYPAQYGELKEYYRVEDFEAPE